MAKEQANTKYSISIEELVKMPDIRNDFIGNDIWMNKLTNRQLDQFDREARNMCIEEGVENKYPDLNAAIVAKYIDRGILYKLFTMGNQNL
jgi:hypothetical protein